MNTIEVMRKALEALTCSGEPDDPGHRCGHCDDYVDRNGPVRAALRAELERLETVEPVAWGVTYHASWEPTDLFFSEDEARIEAENCGWTARVVPLYPAPIAPSIPALTIEDVAASAPEFADVPKYGPAYLAGAHWAYTLAAARCGARIIKADPLQELADDARQIGLEC